MGKNGLRKNFAKNVTYALIAQCFSLVVSVLMSLIVPKMLGVEQFAYWQLFVFYVGYVGLFHFGLSDGVYLKYGGIHIENLDKNSIGSQMKLMIALHILTSVAIIIATFSINDPNRRLVWIFTSFQLVLCNIYWYLGYVFQAANETRVYSITTIIIKISFILFLLMLFVINPKRFLPFLIIYLISQMLGTGYILWKGRKFLFSCHQPLKTTIFQAFDNCRIGISLTFSNIASSLILGIGRIFVDAGKGLEAFGMVSLALSLTNFFLQFISQISMVMFPALRQVNKESQIEWYIKLRSLLSYLLCAIMIFYVPVESILKLWLPQYEQSFKYLAILLPICIFDGKMQLLYNTYLKVLHKERILLAINLVVLGFSSFLCAISVFVLKSVVAVVIFQVAVIAIRSIIANMYLAHHLDVPFEKNILWECFLTCTFIIGNQFLPGLYSWIVYSAVLLIYLLISKSTIKGMLN